METSGKMSHSTLPLTALVLAGGQSSRMGQDKALIPIQGTPLLQQVCQVALQCTSEVYVVTPWINRYQALLPKSCKFIQEPPWSGAKPQGPLVGFAQGLAQVQTEWVLLLACDLPRLRVEVLQEWVQELATVPGEAIAVLARQTNRWEPLCGFYRQSCLASLTCFIEQGGRSFQAWLAQHPVQELPPTDAQMFFNCNTPKDVDSLKKFNSPETSN